MIDMMAPFEGIVAEEELTTERYPRSGVETQRRKKRV
jgi:hypothetical protein